MKISLITGGAGFIGSHVAKHCLDMGHRVVILDDLSGGFMDNIPEGADFIEGSVADHKLVAKLFDIYEFNFVYHLAAYAAEGLSHFIRRFNYNNNLIGSVNLINESVRNNVECFVFTSSIAVYGVGQLPMTEDMVPQPEDPYGISKYAVELDLKTAHEMFGLNYVIFRPHNVYGENQNIGDKYRNVIGIFMNQIMSNVPMTVFGNGKQTRAFSYIDDVSIPISRSVDNPKARNETFNIGADTPYTVNELTKTVAHHFGVSAEVTHLSERNEVMHAYSDHTKARDIFKLGTPVALDEGIGRMAEWAKRVGARKSKDFDNIELFMKLPDSWKTSLMHPKTNEC